MEKKKQGLVLSHYIPYGYKKNGKSLLPDPGEQGVLQRTKKWRESGQTFEAIDRRLQKAGIPTKRNRVWRGYTVSDILRREEKLVETNL